MCNQILFTTSLCGHSSSNNPELLPPIFDNICTLALRHTCPELTTTHSILPHSRCPSCDPNGALPYGFYKHEFFSETCGHAFGHENSDLVRLLDEDDVVLATPTAETCGEELCKGRVGRGDKEPALGRSRMPEWDGLSRIFTKNSKWESTYLGDDMKPRTKSTMAPGSLKPQTSTSKASAQTRSSIHNSSNFRDETKYKSQSSNPDDAAMDFPTAHYNSKEARVLTEEKEMEMIMNFPSTWADPKYWPPSTDKSEDVSKSSPKRQPSASATHTSFKVPTSKHNTEKSTNRDVSSTTVSSRADDSHLAKSQQLTAAGREPDDGQKPARSYRKPHSRPSASKKSQTRNK